MRNAFLCFTLALVGISTTSLSLAQEYPSRHVRIVVPYPPGGSNDVVARLIGNKLSENMRQQFIVENRAGAAGTIGAAHVVNAAPDGYTLLVASAGAISTAPSMYPKLPYDPLTDLTPVINVVFQPNILVVHPSVPVKTTKEFIAIAKANPDKFTYGSSGIGATQHLASELFSMMTGTKIVHVPYKGGGPAMIDLMSGQIDFMFSVLPTAVPHVKSGKLKAIAVTSARRVKAFPELPTVAESGLPGFEISGFIALFAPSKVPREIVNKLHTEAAKTLTPDIEKRLIGLGLDVDGGPAEKFSAFLKQDIERYIKIVKSAKIPLQ
jgi:tripartite-type tricarboxylate transporter receptor subunit TctC